MIFNSKQIFRSACAITLHSVHPGHGGSCNRSLRQKYATRPRCGLQGRFRQLAMRGDGQKCQVWSAKTGHCWSRNRYRNLFKQITLAVEAIQNASGYTRAPISTLGIAGTTVRSAALFIEIANALAPAYVACLRVEVITVDPRPAESVWNMVLPSAVQARPLEISKPSALTEASPSHVTR